ncbi:MAG: protein-disulfide reductase DsbD [Aquabacterium sp.]
MSLGNQPASTLFQSLRVIGLTALLSFGSAMAASAPADATDFLEPEQAFQMTARPLDAHTVEVRFTVADGYYLYRQKFSFQADQGVVLGNPGFPAAHVKDDPQFGKTEIYRNELVFPLDVKQASGPFQLTVRTQGCADAGLCYPPFVRTARITLPAGPSQTEATAATTTDASGNTDESGRIGTMFQQRSIGLILISFFGFGLLLAFTPCVFPMIPILSGIIVGHGEAITKKRALTLSLAYVMGMAVTYTLAGVGAGLSGTLLSSALQNAWVLGGFGLVFVALSLSMFGFYDLQLPASLQSRLSESANRQGGSLLGVSLMGALSALIVGPCVAAPLAGALLYIAQTKDAVLGGAALFTMALGMGAPLIIVGVAAGSMLPRAGGWMEGVKKAFGVMLLGVAVWLISPVASPLIVMLAWAALLLFSGIYLRALDPLPVDASGWSRFWKGVGVMASLAGAVLFVGAMGGSRDPLNPLASLRGTTTAVAQAQGVKFDKVRSVAELEAQLANADRPVMLDFYADWCVSCKEMEHLTFTDANVRDRLDRMRLIQVDVTNNTDNDKALLKRFGLFGPPGMVFFAPGSNREVRRVVGFQKAEDFVKVLEVALNKSTMATQVSLAGQQ